MNSRYVEIIGKKFDKLTVLSKVIRDIEIDRKRGSRYLCRCDCGNLIEMNKGSLCRKKGTIHNCGCVGYTHKPIIRQDMIGIRFGHLTVLSRSNNTRPVKYNCICDCGNSTETIGYNLRNGRIQSCGCTTRDHRLVHSKYGTKEYNTWLRIMGRCYNIKNPSYYNYGARGITVCNEWREPKVGFVKFLEHIGNAPSREHSIDRINPLGNYEPGNVRWATAKEQGNNRRKRLSLPDYTDTEIETEYYRRHLDREIHLRKA